MHIWYSNWLYVGQDIIMLKYKIKMDKMLFNSEMWINIFT